MDRYSTSKNNFAIRKSSRIIGGIGLNNFPIWRQDNNTLEIPKHYLKSLNHIHLETNLTT